jgi:RNA polymerase sigma factor (sigma-70 family)
MLARKFSAAWIADNGRDLLSRANTEYIEWLEDNRPAANPVGWVLNCAYWRAQNLLDSERRKPRPAPLDSVFHLADEATPDPEQQALENDRRRRLMDALAHLPPKEAKLLALVYYDGQSIREAGRQLGWGKSAADRHHKAAMEKMAALVGDPKLLSHATIAAAAQAAVSGEGQGALRALADGALLPAREAIAVSSDAVEVGAHRLADLTRRIFPFADAGNAAASGGAGRVLAQCGAAAGIAVCSLVAGPALDQGVQALVPDRHGEPRREAPAPSRPRRPTPSPTPAREAPAPSTSTDRPAAAVRTAARRERRRRQEEARASKAPPPPPAAGQTGSEFGSSNFEPGSSEAEQPAEPEPAPAAPPPADHGGGSSAGEFGL